MCAPGFPASQCHSDRRGSIMPYYRTWEEFTRAAEKLYQADPMKVRVALKYRHSDGTLRMKVTDDVVVSCSWGRMPSLMCSAVMVLENQITLFAVQHGSGAGREEDREVPQSADATNGGEGIPQLHHGK
ncbi:signal recognition particle 9 kDa protein isoform X1 [Ranitomeya variabilis]|uniref:signal recognition particle 9 kDa protein isoform X1 n=1 Tax=Ranitomeya variabilis TaxID=490064 RepID=UPI0040571879